MSTIIDKNKFRSLPSDVATITQIIRVDEAPSGITPTNLEVTGQSAIYGWVDNNKIYFYSAEEIIYFNLSNYFFQNFQALTSLDCNKLKLYLKQNDNCYGMFFRCYSLVSLNISNFDTSNVTSMAIMFFGCHSLVSLDISNFNTSKVRYMNSMFLGCKNLEKILISDKWSTENVTSSNSMFDKCTKLPNFDSSIVDATKAIPVSQGGYLSITTMISKNKFRALPQNIGTITAIERASELPAAAIGSAGIGLSVINGAAAYTNLAVDGYEEIYGWVEDNVIYLYSLADIIYIDHASAFFSNFKALQSLDFNTLQMQLRQNETNCISMFNACSQIKSIIGLSNWNVNSVINMSYMFNACNKLTRIDNVSNWNVSNVTDMTGMFSNCSNLQFLGDLSNWNVSNVTNMYHMFGSCRQLTSIGDLSNWKVDNVTNMYGMFRICDSLTSLGDLSNWNVSNVTNMSQMFLVCTKLTSLGDLSNWNVGKVTNMNGMFNSCYKLQQIGGLSNWNVSNVTDMSQMFTVCTKLTSLGDLSNWDVSNVTDMGQMFASCQSITSLDLSNWHFNENLIDISNMFFNCYLLQNLDLSNWNVSNITNMNGMFNFCKTLVDLDLTSFNTSKVENMTNMFSNCYSLQHIYISPEWSTESVTESTNMFRNSPKLPNFDSNYVDVVKAIPTRQGGYLTLITKFIDLDLLTYFYSKLKLIFGLKANIDLELNQNSDHMISNSAIASKINQLLSEYNSWVN